MCIKNMKSNKFNFELVEDFDKHIKLSIPNFEGIDNIFGCINKEYAQPESIVLDLGCSTGRYLNSLEKINEVTYIGCDTINFKNRKANFDFVNLDIEEALNNYKDQNVSVIICMFTLQFLGLTKRNRVLKLLKDFIDNGTTLLISEKTYLSHIKIQTLLHRLHIQDKRKYFTDKEILDKDNQLSVSMFCKTEKELEIELQELGYATKVWQSYNFMGYCVQKYGLIL